MSIVVYTDGGSRNNPGEAATGYVITSGGQTLFEEGERIGKATNNVAEYMAMIHALTKLTTMIEKKEIETDVIVTRSDSSLMVNQLNGLFKIKDDTIRGLVEKVVQIKKNINISITHEYIPREKNTQADALVKQKLYNS